MQRQKKQRTSYCDQEVGTLPKVSVIIPVYNHGKYIRECVESALAQDYENLEVIVVDDGSTDNTPEILKEFEGKIKYIRQENRGAAAAFNHGLRLAEGSLITWLSSDDIFLPNKISHQVRKFQEDPARAMVYTDYIRIDAGGGELEVVHSHCPPPERFVREYLTGGFVSAVTMLIRRECLEKIGSFDESLRAYEDYDMVLRLLKHYRFGYIPIPLMKYRWHSANMSHKFRILQKCRDRLFLKVLRDFSPQEIFGDLLENKDLGAAYKWLSLVFARQFAFRAASVAMTKSMRESFSLKRAFLLSLFRFLSTKPVLAILLPVRQIRGRIKKWWLDRRKIRGKGRESE